MANVAVQRCVLQCCYGTTVVEKKDKTVITLRHQRFDNFQFMLYIYITTIVSGQRDFKEQINYAFVRQLHAVFNLVCKS